MEVIYGLKIIEVDNVPAYLSYFHHLAEAGIGERDVESVTIMLVPIDRKYHEKLDDIKSITLSYDKKEKI